MPFFSIITPIYNTEKYLKECLDSLINQSFKNIEIILVNDGSTDNSGEIAREYAKNDKRIKFIEQKNQGQSIARNNALAVANGEYIVFVDSDDYIALNMCEKLFNILKDNPVDVLLINYNKIGDTSAIIQKNASHFLSIFPSNCTINSADLVQKINKTKHFITTVAHFICKKDLVQAIHPAFPPNLLYEDVYFATNLIIKAKTIYCYNYGLYHYRYNPESTMHGPITAKKLNKMLSSYFDLAYYFYSNATQYPKPFNQLFIRSSKICLKHIFKMLNTYKKFNPKIQKNIYLLKPILSPKQKLLLYLYMIKYKQKRFF